MTKIIIDVNGGITAVSHETLIAAEIQHIIKRHTVEGQPAPLADDVAQAVTGDEMKTHPWRLPGARAERKAVIDGKTPEALQAIDAELATLTNTDDIEAYSPS